MTDMKGFTPDDAKLLEEVFSQLWFDKPHVESDEFHKYLANFLYDLLATESERDIKSRFIDEVHDLLYLCEPGMSCDDREAEIAWIQGAHAWIAENIGRFENPYLFEAYGREDREISLETLTPKEMAHKVAVSLDRNDGKDDYDPYNQIPDGYEYDDWDD